MYRDNGIQAREHAASPWEGLAEEHPRFALPQQPTRTTALRIPTQGEEADVSTRAPFTSHQTFGSVYLPREFVQCNVRTSFSVAPGSSKDAPVIFRVCIYTFHYLRYLSEAFVSALPIAPTSRKRTWHCASSRTE